MKDEKITFQREIPVRHDVDVFVAGGGPAGVSAAVIAAREGRKVFLAEGHSSFGGMGTAGMVPGFVQFSDGVNFLAGGFGKELVDKLVAMGNPVPMPDRQAMRIKTEILKRLYDDLMISCGAKFSLMTQLIGVEKDKDRVTTAILSGKSGLFGVKAKVFIDCTGDGDLAALAGAPFEKGDAEGNLMPGTLCSLWANIDWDVVDKYSPKPQSSKLEEAFNDKVFDVLDRHLPGMNNLGGGIGGGNISHAFGVDGTDEQSLTEHFISSRKLLLQYETYYKKYLRGFERMELVNTGSLFGIRETRRILGDYVMTVDDFVKRAVFDDEIGRYSYSIDIHPSKPSDETYAAFRQEFKKTYAYKAGESYGIPYRSLIPRTLANVLTAGRCISTDRYMHGSIRVMPGCFITGQSAGMAGALASEEEGNVRKIDVRELQGRLKKIGAFLPNWS